MEQFGKYQLVRRIGVGGMAEVFLARATVAPGQHKDLVIKKIHPAHARSRRFVSMFASEAKIALRLNHPNIVHVFDFGAVGGTFFLAMEYVDGVDVLRLLRASQRAHIAVPLPISAFLAQEVARGLDYAHRRTDEFGQSLDIVHRDVSPQNILVSREGAVKLVDFGIARARWIDDDDEGAVKGKYAYMAPEQARADTVDHRADVFAVGAVLFELCCHRPLFFGQGKELLALAKAGAIVRPRDLNPQIPLDLEAIVLKALAFHPDDRFASARDMQTALEHFLERHAQRTGHLVDTSVVARFAATVLPAESRDAPPAEEAPAPRNREVTALAQTALPHPLDTTDASGEVAGDTSAPGIGRDIRERKPVLVVAGRMLHNASAVAAADRDSASARANTLSADFAQIAPDIAFKHHAHVHALDGTALVFVVGVPVADEDDPMRAVQLALALLDALEALGRERTADVRLALGIQQGMAVLERRGNRNSMGAQTWDIDIEPAPIRAAQCLAAGARGGEILVSDEVHQLAQDDWHFAAHHGVVPAPHACSADADATSAASRPVGAAAALATDISQGSRYYRLQSPKDRHERLREHTAWARQIVGRELELKMLRDAYREVRTRRSKKHVLISGEAGVGKRSLVNAFVDGIPQGQAVILRAMPRLTTAYTPYAIIADLARDLMGIEEGAPPDAVHDQIEYAIAALYSDRADTPEANGTRAALRMLLTGERPRDDMNADEHRQGIFQAILRGEQLLAPGMPLVVVSEDAHWSDDESLDLIRDLLRRSSQRPILALFTSRPDTRMARIAAELKADIWPLEDLHEQDSIALIRQRFAPDRDVTPLAEQIIARTGGNPRFIRGVLDNLLERGIIVADRDSPPRGTAMEPLLRWVDRDAAIEVPASVESLLAMRIDHLPAGEKQVMLHAAVLGRVFRANMVAELLARPVADDLAGLVQRGLLHVRDGRYSFRNHTVMAVAYRLLPADERSRLHRLAAEHIANAPLYRAGRDDAVVARHLELAGDAAPAAERYLRAAAHAVEIGGNGDALRQLTRALRLLPGDDWEGRFDAHCQRAEILRRLARVPEQLHEIRDMLAIAEAMAEPAKLALSYARLVQFYIDTGSTANALRAVGLALDHARKSGDALTEAEALRLRATVARLLGDGNGSLAMCQQALDLCDDSRAGLTQRAAILNSCGNGLWTMGRLEEAVDAYAQGLAIYSNLHMPREEARAFNNMGIVFTAMGELEAALANFQRALDIDKRLGDRASVALKLSNLGQSYAELGDFARAERCLRKAVTLAEERNDDKTRIDAAISLGQVYLQTNRYKSAVVLFERGLTLGRTARNRYQEIRAQIYLAMAQLEAGHAPDKALELTRAAIDEAERMPMPVGQIFGLAVQGLALAALGQPQEAIRASAKAVALQSERKQSEDAEQVLYIHAILCEGAGQHVDAVAAIRQARREMEAKAKRMNNPQHRALYLDSKIPAAILTAHERLVEPASEAS